MNYKYYQGPAKKAGLYNKYGKNVFMLAVFCRTLLLAGPTT